MVIGVDKAQKEGKHDLKHNSLIQMGHDLVFLPLPVGDYVIADDAVQEVIKRRGSKLHKMDLIGVTKVSVDTKYGLEECYGNLVGGSKAHERFRDECILAKQNGIKLTILVESGPEVMCMEDVKAWRNWKQLYAYCRRNHIPTGKGMMDRIDEFVSFGGQKPPVGGEQLYKTMNTMSERYGIAWEFCRKEDTGRRIIEILTDPDWA